MLFEAGVGERSPRPFGYRVVRRLLVQLGDEVGPSRGEVSSAPSLFRAAGCPTVNVDQHDRQAMAAECVSQGAGMFHDLVG